MVPGLQKRLCSRILSLQPTLFPCCPSAIAKLAERRLFPTPPFPLAIGIICAIAVIIAHIMLIVQIRDLYFNIRAVPEFVEGTREIYK